VQAPDAVECPGSHWVRASRGRRTDGVPPQCRTPGACAARCALEGRAPMLGASAARHAPPRGLALGASRPCTLHHGVSPSGPPRPGALHHGVSLLRPSAARRPPPRGLAAQSLRGRAPSTTGSRCSGPPRPGALHHGVSPSGPPRPAALHHGVSLLRASAAALAVPRRSGLESAGAPSTALPRRSRPASAGASSPAVPWFLERESPAVGLRGRLPRGCAHAGWVSRARDGAPPFWTGLAHETRTSARRVECTVNARD